MGFRKGRSPELMLLTLTEKLLLHLKKGQYVGLICIDFSKAFDSVCHVTLLKKLQGDSYEWSQSYLNCRSQFTVVNGETSERAPVEQGVPQGSLLGPRFYSYHANNLPEVADSEDQLEDQEQLEMFADDTNGVSC